MPNRSLVRAAKALFVRTSDVDQLHDRDGAANVGYVGLQSQHLGHPLEGGFGPSLTAAGSTRTEMLRLLQGRHGAQSSQSFDFFEHFTKLTVYHNWVYSRL